MESPLLSTSRDLSATQKATLARANIKTVSDIVLIAPFELAKRCRLSPSDAQSMINMVCKEFYRAPQTLDEPSIRRDEVFSTGDKYLDDALGGGIRTGKVWEVVGESAAGKSQLGFHLSLFVQLPRSQGGISGSTCFLSTSWTLPTNRLLEIISENPRLSTSVCGLSDIHTLKTPTRSVLIRVLSSVLPEFIKARRSLPNAKPVRLLIIDALMELFHSDSSTSTSKGFFERSKEISEIGAHLHALASEYNLAIIVINEVADAFSRNDDYSRVDTGKGGEIPYKDQAKLFGRADSIPGENRKEAVLGLVWANIINARIMLTRTERMQDLPTHGTRPNKRRRTNEYTGGPSPPTSNNPSERHSIRIRRLTVVFNQNSPPTSLDYVVTQQGISVVNEDAEIPPSQPRPRSPEPIPSQSLAVEIAEDDPAAAMEPEQIVHPETEDRAEEGPGAATDDEWDEYWKLVENEDPLFNAFDFEALDSTHS